MRLSMSRSAIDATRFTSTKPYASFNPSSISSSPSASSSSTFSPSSSPSAPSQPFPRSANPSYPSRIPRNSNLNNAKTNFAPPPPSSGPTETPAQKVARLRRERAAKREAEFTRWDRIVLRGRVIADAAHRITVLGLVTFSVLTFGVTAYALTDMIVYNRRKRKAWYADQARERQNTLTAAIENEKAGLPLSEDQALILNQERIRFADEEERARRKRERWEYLNVKRWLLSGLKSDEEQPGREVVEGDMQPTSAETPQEASEKDPTARGGVLAAVENARRAGEKPLEAEGAKGGALDRMAARAAELGKRWGWGNSK